MKLGVPFILGLVFLGFMLAGGGTALLVLNQRGIIHLSGR